MSLYAVEGWLSSSALSACSYVQPPSCEERSAADEARETRRAVFPAHNIGTQVS